MGNKNFIVINGKKYDTVTGKLIQEDQDSSPVKNTASTIKRSGGVVDGFVRKPVSKKPRTSQAHNITKKTQKSQTLMRQAVKKPIDKSPNNLNKSQPQIHKSQLGTSTRRTQLAKSVPKSDQIKKYESPANRTSIVKTNSELKVVIPPQAVNKQQHNSNPQKNSSQKTISKTSSTITSDKIIEAALVNANSHAETHSKKTKRKRGKLFRKLGISPKAAGVSSAVLAGVLLGGFFAVQNIPNLSMKVASTRAGFNATMPGYQPSGFSFKGPINYTTGRVVVAFKSNTDNREYEVIQQSSSWNSDALLSNFVVAENKQYQTYVDRGRTLYIYDGSNATWVDNGIWYTVEGESDMTTDQLIRIAASI